MSPYVALFEPSSRPRRALVARWMLVGFVHGVMNTDNTTISGETIDYGPCALMDAYDPATVFSSIDHGGRYAYGNQPRIMQWNLARLGEALLPLLGDRASNRPSRRPRRCCRRSPSVTKGTGSTACAPSSGSPAPTPDDAVLVQDLLDLLAAQRSTTRRPCDRCRASCTATPTPARTLFDDAGGVRRVGRRDGTAGAEATNVPPPTWRPRWTPSTRSTSRATTSSRRR